MNAKKTKKNAKPKKHRVSVIDRIIELENRMAVVEGTIAGLNPAVPTPPLGPVTTGITAATDVVP